MFLTETPQWQALGRQILTRAGEELGPVMDDFSGRRNVKHGEGAIGIFTNGLIERTTALEIALTYALARFITPENYREIE